MVFCKKNRSVKLAAKEEEEAEDYFPSQEELTKKLGFFQEILEIHKQLHKDAGFCILATEGEMAMLNVINYRGGDQYHHLNMATNLVKHIIRRLGVQISWLLINYHRYLWFSLARFLLLIVVFVTQTPYTWLNQLLIILLLCTFAIDIFMLGLIKWFLSASNFSNKSHKQQADDDDEQNEPIVAYKVARRTGINARARRQ